MSLVKFREELLAFYDHGRPPTAWSSNVRPPGQFHWAADLCTPNRDPTPLRREVLKLEGSYRVTNMPVYFGMYLLQQMTLAAIFSWWLAPLEKCLRG